MRIGQSADKGAYGSKHQARFISFDGSMPVEEACIQRGRRADLRTSLEKGNFVRTGGTVWKAISPLELLPPANMLLTDHRGVTLDYSVNRLGRFQTPSKQELTT
ncbi:MAG: hypothetical protein ACLQVM_14875 [Terriglobia bacterium]